MRATTASTAAARGAGVTREQAKAEGPGARPPRGERQHVAYIQRPANAAHCMCSWSLAAAAGQVLIANVQGERV